MFHSLATPVEVIYDGVAVPTGGGRVGLPLPSANSLGIAFVRSLNSGCFQPQNKSLLNNSVNAYIEANKTITGRADHTMKNHKTLQVLWTQTDKMRCLIRYIELNSTTVYKNNFHSCLISDSREIN